MSKKMNLTKMLASARAIEDVIALLKELRPEELAFIKAWLEELRAYLNDALDAAELGPSEEVKA